MLTNKIPLRFSKFTDVDMLTGTAVALYLEDTMGDLPDIRFTDVEDFREYWNAIEKEFYEVYSEIKQLKIENRELNDENQMLKKTNKRTESTYHALQKKFHNWNIALSKCREENEQLKQDRFLCLDCEHSGYTEIGCLCEKKDHWTDYKTECEDYRELE